MTIAITILKLEAPHKIPRPFARACSVAELAEMIAFHGAIKTGQRRKFAQEQADRARKTPGDFIALKHIDTDEPVAIINGASLYAFHEI